MANTVTNTNLHALQDDGLLLVAQRLSSDHILQASHSHDVSRARDIDVLSAVGMHEQQAADALAGAFVAVQRKCALRHRATAATYQDSQSMWLPAGTVIRRIRGSKPKKGDAERKHVQTQDRTGDLARVRRT